ncbi:TraR/DksA C4-type zinc finger protein [Desulfurispora thermophila]|uniref:TraR/DksA C4-type zinc finger protein n=1 Tax=Desulfurispora thermophila TaxID=265470 RepID=UPI00037E1470|nr:TraR/DksA C4-type zinc finger protein [Desulfurispora thermophila]
MGAKEHLEKIRRQLEKQKADLQALATSMQESGLHEPMADAVGEISLYDNHPADVATEIFERSKDLALKESAKITLGAVNDALQRIDSGTYGICTACGRRIPWERLQAVPQTTMCKGCQEASEVAPVHQDRPVEEEVMEDILRQPFRPGLDSVQLDWMDAFRSVARTGEHAAQSGDGAYYGDLDIIDERAGAVEDVDSIPAEKVDGMWYEYS